jgi:hypothetical protein
MGQVADLIVRENYSLLYHHELVVGIVEAMNNGDAASSRLYQTFVAPRK